MKTCTKCKVEKPETEFWKNKTTIDGLGLWCKECKKKLDKECYKNNSEKICEKRKEYYKNNREKILDQNKKYCNDNLKKRNEYKKEWYKNNREKVIKWRREYDKEYCKNNPDKRITYYINGRIKGVSDEIKELYKLNLQLKRELQKCKQNQSMI